jgi:hypothetical protein
LSPRTNAENVGSFTSTTPFIELPNETFTWLLGTRPSSNRPSRTAIFEAATANWLNRAAIRPAIPPIQSFVSKFLTSPTIWQG